MILKWKRSCVTKIAGIFIYPGNNIIPEMIGENQDTPNPAISVILNDPTVKEKKELGMLELVQVKKAPEASKASETSEASEDPEDSGSNPDEFTSDITEMNSKDSVAIVKETLHVNVLEKMLLAEKAAGDRKSVKKAIKKQIDMLRKEDK